MRTIDPRAVWRAAYRAAAERVGIGWTLREAVNAADGAQEAEVTIMGSIGWDVWADEFVPRFAAIKADRINVLINSPGGDVFDGVAIHDAIRRHPAEVTTMATGMAASAASYILQAGARRIATPASTVMIHDALALTIGNAADHRATADILDKISGQIAGIYAARSGVGDAASWREQMLAESWFTAQEALDAGLVDEVVDPSQQSSQKSGAAASVPAARAPLNERVGLARRRNP